MSVGGRAPPPQHASQHAPVAAPAASYGGGQSYAPPYPQGSGAASASGYQPQYQPQYQPPPASYGGPPASYGGPGHAPASTYSSGGPGGVRRALLIGINYRGTSAELGGCINDARVSAASALGASVPGSPRPRLSRRTTHHAQRPTIQCMAHLLKTRFHFTDSDILLLSEENSNPVMHPTRQNIINVSVHLAVGVPRGGK